MKKLLLVILSLPLFLIAGVNIPATADAACDKSLLGLPVWYKYLDGTCENITGPYNAPGDPDSGLNWQAASGRIAIAIIEILIRIGTLVAVGYVIYGGFRYITSQGEPENTKSARQTILNAVIGLVIALVATASVAFLTNVMLDQDTHDAQESNAPAPPGGGTPQLRN